jgi:hypothetical protein|tara:strand:+ start:382 stop:726 length:345 start_codon:yes stop_codon:yes gene_type:complete
VVEKVDFFEGVKSHFEALDVKIIEVPEWNMEGDKSMYVRPFTMKEKARLFKGANDNDLNVLVDIIIAKAEDKSGNKMFDIGHKPKFMVKADTDVISRVAQEILTQDSLKDLKKK